MKQSKILNLTGIECLTHVVKAIIDRPDLHVFHESCHVYLSFTECKTEAITKHLDLERGYGLLANPHENQLITKDGFTSIIFRQNFPERIV